ncbi:Ig-like domain-containing protein [Methanosphaera sp. BMS]|uniref:Ig-like domain-containing protein n=1 Tax=Methanosphaera sp. BMS TaxID=1789762 RepID=UPI00214F9777|nr:Ig-like domain-containing protein [Methanosphaera sp. BMS]
MTPFEEPVTTGSTITLNAKVTVSDTPITTGKIIFKINGKTLKDANGKVIYAKLDSNGEVSVNYNIGNLKVNTYTVKAVFTDSRYDKIESDTTMTVVKC